MDMKTMAGKLPAWLKKFRYPLLVLALGLVLMALPGIRTGQETTTPTAAQTRQEPDMALLLTDILGRIEGVGKVQVLLSVAAGEQVIYQTDTDANGIRKETVIITDSSRNEQALVSQVLPKEYRGAIVVCQGGDSPAVRLAVVEAVRRATGLGADCIAVLKMK